MSESTFSIGFNRCFGAETKEEEWLPQVDGFRTFLGDLVATLPLSQVVSEIQLLYNA